MKFWQIIALISGAIFALVMALASISYNTTLGSDDPAFALIPISNKILFQALALGFDLGMVASVFGFWHWLGVNRIAASICLALFIISSAFSVHSLRGYIALNVSRSLTPQLQTQDVYASLKRDLDQAQSHLTLLQNSLAKTSGRSRKQILQEIQQQSRKIEETRNTLGQSKLSAVVTPIPGLDWYLAVILWFFNATCWTAWFGTKFESQLDTQLSEHDSVLMWLHAYRGNDPEHCTRLYDGYAKWCTQQSCTPLVKYSFYARLIELGAEKFRKNGNGPTHYRLPHALIENDRLEA